MVLRLVDTRLLTLQTYTLVMLAFQKVRNVLSVYMVDHGNLNVKR